MQLLATGTWLGTNADGKIGLTHVWDRVAFSLEDMTSDGLGSLPRGNAAPRAVAIRRDSGDHDGFRWFVAALLYKRLERARFAWPTSGR